MPHENSLSDESTSFVLFIFFLFLLFILILPWRYYSNSYKYVEVLPAERYNVRLARVN